jgi:hypothetical protein
MYSRLTSRTGLKRLTAWSCLLAILLGSLFPGSAQTVQTLGGGPRQIGGAPDGFNDGNTLQFAQFRMPGGMTLDISGGVLFVADASNGAIRRLAPPTPAGTTTTAISGLSTPVDVLMDASTNLYVLTQGDGLIRMYDSFLNLVKTNNASILTSPTAMALDFNGNIYVTELSGALRRVALSDGTVAEIAPAGTFNAPRGIEVTDTGLIAVSDTGNHAIRLVDANSMTISVLAGSIGVSGTNNGLSTQARFNAPYHLAKAGNNVLVVADQGNHWYRTVDGSGNVATLFGVHSNRWSSDFPGWEDGSVASAESRLPTGVVVDGAGNVFVTERHYHLVRSASAVGLSGASGVGSGGTGGGTGGGGGITLNPPTLTMAPNSGYFPLGTTVSITSSSTNVFFTTDGTAPTTNSARVVMSNGAGSIRWKNSTNDLSRLQVSSLLFSGTNVAVSNLSGILPVSNIIGVPPGLNTNLFAGIGSTIVVPIVVELAPGATMKSLQYRLEVTPNGAAPQIPDRFGAVSITTNDFVPVVTSDQTGTNVTTFSASPYTIGSTRGLTIHFPPNQSLSVSTFGVVTMVSIPIPLTASEGDTYSVSVVAPSATPDAGSSLINLTAGASRTILITNITYLVGDTAPGGWYNAGDFGNGSDGTGAGQISNNDVNGVFFASIGVREPYPFTDVFDAMDVFPEDAPGTVGGDGQIRFLDWQIILLRSLMLNTNSNFAISANNWTRRWSAGGNRVPGATNLNSGFQIAGIEPQFPGRVWERQVLLTASTVGNAIPGAGVLVPIYARVSSVAPVAGLHFRAVVTPTGGAPALTSPVQFISSYPDVQVVTPSIGEAGVAWNFGRIALGGGSSNLLGFLVLNVPLTAAAGDCYTVSLANADGAPSLSVQYDFETRSGCVVVLDAAPTAGVSQVSDEWRRTFFPASQGGDDLVDDDGDGFVNLFEYLAGTNPTNANSVLRLDNLGQIAGAPVFGLLSAPGKTYVLECRDHVSGAQWQAVATNSGTGQMIQMNLSNGPGGTRFYRLRVIP